MKETHKDKKYAIITIKEVEDVDWSKVCKNSPKELRFSYDGKYAIIKFKGNVPSFLESKETYSLSEIKEIIANPNGVWGIKGEETWVDNLKNEVDNTTWKGDNPLGWLS